MYNSKLIVIGLVIIMTVFLIVFEPQSNTLAQNTSGATKSPEWLQIVGLAGVTAAISSAAISSVVNYIITTKKIREELQSAIDRLKFERQVNRVEDWLNLYASIIFHLKKLREFILAREQKLQQGVNTSQIESQVDNLATDIDSLLKGKFYLISDDVVGIWINFNNNYYDIGNVKSLIDQLIKEYNKNIREEYKKLLGREIHELSD